jgi:SAM-dependent methyltransferase
MQETIDLNRVEAFAGQMLGDLGATVSGALVHLGDRLGLYRAMAAAGPLTSQELADRTGTAERYVREWLGNQTASGYVHYDRESGRYVLPPEHAAVLADETSPAFMVGGFGAAVALFQILERAEDVFRSGEGVGWHEHDPRLFCGTERFFGPAYRTHLVTSWIPALEGVQQKLARGARVADVGCGHGLSTLLLAEAFPNSELIGFDVHNESIATARNRAREAGLEGRVRFERATAQAFPGEGYDLVTICDALHDMGDPEGAVRNIRKRLAPDGTLMIVEPMAGDCLEDNLNPVGRAYYGFSTMICTPASLSQHGRCGLGAQAGEAKLREVLTAAGFRRIRRATETPVNIVLEAKP